MDFEEYLNSTAQAIDQEVEEILINFLEEVKKANPRLTPFVLGLINSCKGGKRVRGVLVKLGYELGGGLPNKEILKIGAAFEILHAAILIHDDIADQSPLRRDQPSLYKALGGDLPAGRQDHYGISQAINIGDIGLYLPIKIITETSLLGEYRLKALTFLSQIIINTGLGQILDVELDQKEGEFSEDDIKFININKTAKYTIAGPLQIGAILGGAEDKLLQNLGQFGEDLGIAFQIQDDILDAEVESVDEAKSSALDFALKAKNIIPMITSDGKMKKLLEQMTEFMINRNK